MIKPLKVGSRVRYNVQLSDDRFTTGTGVIVSVQSAISEDGDLYRVKTDSNIYFRAFGRELELIDYPDD